MPTRPDRARALAPLAAVACISLAAPATPPARAAAPPSKHLLVRAGRLLDVGAGAYLADQGILVENDRIEVGPFADVRARAPRDAVVLDLGRATVLPGIIDGHAHLLDAMEPQWRTGEAILLTTSMSPSSRALLGARNAREALEGGITTVRNVGHSGLDGDAALRDAVEAGWVPGPRIQAAARKISPPGGQAGRMRSEIARAAVDVDYFGVSTPEEARRAVREDLAAGADLIKVVVDADARMLSLEDLRAIVEEARRAKVKVAAHATGEEAIRIAVEAGVDSVDHGDDVGGETLAAMRAKGTFLVETHPFSAARYTEFVASAVALTDEDRREIDEYFRGDLEKSRRRVQRAMKAGVRIAAGSDMWFRHPSRTRGQATMLMLEGLRDAGMPAADVLRAATIDAADLLGWSDRVGSLEAGKYADVVALEGDPLADPGSLKDVRFVMKGGAVVRNDLAGR